MVKTRREWFDRWCENPARIVPRMEMPAVKIPVRGVLNEKIDDQLADHPLHLLVERHGAAQHVVEYRRRLRAEIEVGQQRPGHDEEPVFDEPLRL